MKHPHNKDTIEAITALYSLDWSMSKIGRAVGINRKKIAAILAHKNQEATTQDSLNSQSGGPEQELDDVRQCSNCTRSFIPDPRHLNRQKYCRRAECRLASKRRSQRKWTDKNPDYWV